MWTKRLLVAVVMLVGSGCAIVPTSGSPRVWGEDTGRDTLSQPYVRIIAEPPRKDAEPLDVVKGFLAATASFDDPTLAVARLYLTSEALRKWKPYDTAQVYDGRFTADPVSTDDKNTTVRLKYESQATIDSEGRFAPLTSAGDQPFGLTKINGQWRISDLPDGRWLSSDDLKRAYRQMDLYYPPATHVTGLVLDRVWEPIDPSTGVAETRVRRLLSGPTKTIRSAVASAFPLSAKLNRISVEGNTVVVDFDSGLLDIRSDQMNAMKAQLAWTLGDLVAGRIIEVRVNGEPFRGGLTFKPTEWNAYDPNVLTSSPDAFYMQGGVLRLASEKGPGDPVGGAAGQGTMPFTDPAVSAQSQRVAARADGNGIWVADMVAGSQWQQWIKGTDVTPPSWDRYGAVWTAIRVSDTETQVFTAVGPGNPHRVTIPPDLTGAKFKALRVSRDGARVAMIVDDGSGPQVKIGTIVRSGIAAGIQEVQSLVPPRTGLINAIAWQDAATLLVLSKGKASQELAAWSVLEGEKENNQTIRLDPKSDIQSIAGAPDRVLASTEPDQDNAGEVRLYDDTKGTWVRVVGDAATAPVYPLG
ncbi:GerMN domain-containing protein [Streptosporangiaceae bacterium NEAU-GS5]|nr:GerMN domain-containing protein [Streptosporangiaceae bacterium NEAU-GS5]